MEFGGDQAMGTPGKKKGGPPPADTACRSTETDLYKNFFTILL
jgi:hypothetical protein